MSQAITFTNYSKTDFTHKWDGVDYSFPAGQSMMLESGLAFHFAKHLAVRELNEKGTEYMPKIVVEKEMAKSLNMKSSITAENSTKLQQEVMTRNAQVDEPVKEEVKKEEKKEDSDLEGFEGE